MSLATTLLRTHVGRRVQIGLMTRLFAQVMGEHAPAAGPSGDAALEAFAAFTHRLAAQAASKPDGGAQDWERLRTAACELGGVVKRIVRPDAQEALRILAAAYGNIGIGLAATLPGEVCMRPCYFSRVYSPATCAFMSAFDQGFMEGLTGPGTLEFYSRITQGQDACLARFAAKENRS